MKIIEEIVAFARGVKRYVYRGRTNLVGGISVEIDLTRFGNRIPKVKVVEGSDVIRIWRDGQVIWERPAA